jgi:tetratricopeptide (TPR) repeat protein
LLVSPVTPEELRRSVGPFARQGDQAAVLAREQTAIREMAAVLEREHYPNLAWLIGQEVQNGQGLLVLAVKYYFRREVETNEELARSLEFTQLENLSETQVAGFKLLEQILHSHSARLDQLLDDVLAVAFETRDAVLDLLTEQRRQGEQLTGLYDVLHQLLKQARLLECRQIRPEDSCSIRGLPERQRVLELVTQYHALPTETRRSCPALLNSVALLQVAAGQTQAAQEKFEELATLMVSDPPARAQARFNAYQAALQRRDLPRALEALREAVTLDPVAYAPFPFNDYVPQRILGVGGFGVAFLCEHDVLKRPVVVKALRLDGLERHVEDIFHEAQALNDLEHTAIIRLRDCRFADNARTRPYLVMDYFDSISLSEHIRKHGPLPPTELLPLAKAVAEALHAAHV